MIPQIQCQQHPGKDIVIVDLGKNKIANSRLFCLNCVEDNELKQPLPIERFVEKAKKFGKKQILEIQTEKETLKRKFSKTQKYLNIQKEFVICQLDKIGNEMKKLFQDLTQWMQNEEAKYEELINNITQHKLELLSKYLSGDEAYQKYITSRIPGSIINYLKEILSQFQKDIDSDFRYLLEEQQKSIRSIDNTINPKLLLQSETALTLPCSVLVSNPTQTIIVGAVTNQIVIWQKIEQKLIEQAVVIAHVGTVTALALYDTGEIVSGGDIKDMQLKVWKCGEQEWSCSQILNFPAGITNLQLTPDQEQIILTRADKIISILTKFQGQLEIIQELNNQEGLSIDMSISQNSEFLAISNWTNYINIYLQDQDFQQWNYNQKIESKGVIHRIKFIGNQEFICQQKNPAKLLIYSVNNQGPFELTQELKLWENDDDCTLGFPILIIKESIYCKNELFLYVINRSRGNKYQIDYILGGEFTAGCVDSKGTQLIVKNQSTNKLETYGEE